MVRMIVIATLFLASVCLGAYDSSAVTVNAGGWGSYPSANVGTYLAAGVGYTYFAKSTPITCSGTLTQVKFNFYTDATVATNTEILVTTINGASYTINNRIDANSAMATSMAARAGNTRPLFTITNPVDKTTGLPVTVTSGQIIGIYTKDHAYVIGTAATGFTIDQYNGYFQSDAAMTSTASDKAVAIDVQVSTNEFILFNSTDGGTGFVKDDTVNIPGVPGSPYYIILTEITGLPTDSKVNIAYCDSSGDSALTNTIDCNVAIDNALDTVGFGYAASGVVSQTITDSNLTLNFWRDQTNSLGDVWQVNYINGQGLANGSSGAKDKDVKHISLTGRTSKSVLSGNGMRRLKITQSAGTAVNIGRIVVCRKPWVLVGDSFVSAYDTYTRVQNVGAYLGQDAQAYAPTYQQYMICGGLPGDRVLDSDAGVTSMSARFNAVTNDLGSYRNVVYAFGNGPGINDVVNLAPTTNALAMDYGHAVASTVGAMAGFAQKNGNDVVLCEMVNLEDGYATKTAYTTKMVQTINNDLVILSGQLQVPLAKTYDSFNADPDTYYNADNLHASTAGYQLISSRIVSAYENNQRIYPKSILRYPSRLGNWYEAD